MVAAYEELTPQPTSGDEKILVSVRLRPLNAKECARYDVSDWECINGNAIIYKNNLSVPEKSMLPTSYVFDRVFSPDCSTRQVYEYGAKEVALSVVNGINSSVFAYGQTSSGKTYTMSGITEHTVADIFDHIYKHNEREYTLKFSAMEIYNECVRDLLSMDTTPLRLLDDPDRGTVVERLTEETLRSWNHFKELLSICEAQRQIGETSMNEASSRSHQILRLTIESSTREFFGNYKSSTLTATVNFVDLAGSERASQASTAGTRLKEGSHINRSLLTLGTVIRKLSKGRNGHIPFRDSKLTRILQSSLGGNARTAIICTISPARSHVEQSRNTLLFANCAKEVSTNARINVVVSDKALVKQLQKQLARLESELRNAGSNYMASASTAKLREKDLQIEKLMKEVVELNQRLELAHHQVDNLLSVAEDDRTSTVSGDVYHHYPKLRVRNSLRSENSVSHSPASEDPHFLDIGARSCCQCSVGENSSTSDESFIHHLANFEENSVQTNPFLDLSNCNVNLIGTNPHVMYYKEENHEKFGDICKEVQCITDGKSAMKKYENPEIYGRGLQRIAYSNISPPNTLVGPSGLRKAKNGNIEHHEKDLNWLRSDFITPTSKKPIPWLLEDGMYSFRSVKMIKSRSCGSRFTDMPPHMLKKSENNDSRPTIGFEKIFTEVSQREPVALKHDPVEELSSNFSSTSVDDYQLRSTEASSPSRVSNLDAEIKCIVDHLVGTMETVKDIGLDPIQNDSNSPKKWPSEFKRLQGEIIELWQACSVSLIHRTYFFLLFKGDPTDSFYMEVEVRRLSFLKDTFSKGDETVVDGKILSLASSKRALNRERQMLCKQMQKKLSREERENLFQKWGIALTASNRRKQLVQNLWSKTTDMDHIIDSATVVAKLIDFVEDQEQTLKQSFGLLNFTPCQPIKQKSSIWKRGVLSLL